MAAGLLAVLLAWSSVPSSALRGVASWYAYVPGHAAAGSELRAYLGPGWRGSTVRVCVDQPTARVVVREGRRYAAPRPPRCVSVVLSDWCGCPGRRIVDLDVRSFARLADPSRGLVRIVVR